ncbi:MAG: hypothetical protein JO069_01965 [Verrucomicrobia bacterium]|nr:hypothetical protein [Verrucomicrobiota bacterium]
MDLLHQRDFWAFIGGLCLGLIGVGFLALRFYDAKKEIRRLKRHLADKLELESEATNRLRQDLQEFKQQNENLRIKVANLNQMPDRRLQRELEIFARAERWMVTSSPGFPAVWEEAKRNAITGLEQEEQGRSLPQRVFNALLNRPTAPVESARKPDVPDSQRRLESRDGG